MVSYISYTITINFVLRIKIMPKYLERIENFPTFAASIDKKEQVMKKQLILAVLVLCCAGAAVWYYMRYQERRALVEAFNSDLALRFNDIMDTTYPLIDSFAITLSDRADSIDAIAQRAKANTERKYSDAFGIAWEQYQKQAARKRALLAEYEYFKMSPVFTMLMNSGTQRKAEAEALEKLTVAGLMLKEPYFLEYDSVLVVTKAARQHIADGMSVMEPYRSKQTNTKAWRDVKPEKYFKMFEKYNKDNN